MRIPLFQVDAFTDRPFRGNPAAVCPLESWLEDETMLAIANENNLSETAFLVAEGEDFRLRWFTPLSEMDLCGHATLASAKVVLDHLRPDADLVRFHTRSGLLSVARRGELLEMDFPVKPAEPCPTPDDLLEGLSGGPRPVEVLRSDHSYLAVFEEREQVLAIRPEAAALERLDRLSVIASAPGDGEVDFVSRYFAPRVGVLEDPVTGSAHCVTTPYWSAKLGKRELRARQLSKRGGSLHCSMDGDRVKLAGHAVEVLRGELSF